MKSTSRLIIGTATLCLSVLLSGCGQPGPLYLPKPPASKTAKSGTTPAAPAAPVTTYDPAPPQQ